MVSVNFSKGARKFIEHRGIKSIAISYIEVEAGSIVGIAKDVMITYGRPVSGEEFLKVMVDDIEVFLDKRLKVSGKVVIKKQGFWRFSGLYADGIMIPI